MPYKPNTKSVLSQKTLVGNTYTVSSVGIVMAEASTPTTWTFDVANFKGQSFMITKAILLTKDTGKVFGATLFLFTKSQATLSSAVTDKASNTAPIEADVIAGYYLGRIDFPYTDGVTGGDSEAIATPNTAGNLPLHVKPASDDTAIYGILVTRSTIALTAGYNCSISMMAALD